MVIKTTIEKLFDSYSLIVNFINDSVNDFDIFLEQDICSLTKNDFNRYKSFLFLLSEVIIENYKKDNKISINVLTDILFKNNIREISDKYIYCKHFCPCYHCEPNSEYFESITGIKYLPPQQYCRKSFIELEVSRNIVEQLQLNINLSDIDYEDLDWMVTLNNGNQLSILINKNLEDKNLNNRGCE